MPKVVLEQKALEALASDVRITLLKQLTEKQRTVTQLSKALEMDKGGVHRHLQKLLEGGLVEKDSAHGFTYYRLTWRGRSVVTPSENVRITIMLSGAVAAAIAAVMLLTLATLAGAFGGSQTFPGGPGGAGVFDGTDTDLGGAPDAWERYYGFDPLVAADESLDADQDGLTNLEEFGLGTSPRAADTDGDGVRDLSDPVTDLVFPWPEVSAGILLTVASIALGILTVRRLRPARDTPA